MLENHSRSIIFPSDRSKLQRKCFNSPSVLSMVFTGRVFFICAFAIARLCGSQNLQRLQTKLQYNHLLTLIPIHTIKQLTSPANLTGARKRHILESPSHKCTVQNSQWLPRRRDEYKSESSELWGMYNCGSCRNNCCYRRVGRVWRVAAVSTESAK